MTHSGQPFSVQASPDAEYDAAGPDEAATRLHHGGSSTQSNMQNSSDYSRGGFASGFLFLVATLACAAGVAGTYFFFVRTTTGQYIDESALVEAVAIHGPAGKAATQLLDWLPTLSLVMALIVVIFVCIIRKRWMAAGITVTACVAANLATQVIKDLVPVRPFRGVTTLDLNSLPSGHTTLAASAAAAVFIMASPRWRPLAAFLGGSFAVASGVSTLINQWHRPADVVAAFLVVGVFMFPAGWLVIRTGPKWNVWEGYGRHLGSLRLWVILPVLTCLASAGVAAYSLLMIGPGAGLAGSTVSYFWAGVALIVIAGYVATLAGVWLFGHAVRRRHTPLR